jgi:hypothetical protein
MIEEESHMRLLTRESCVALLSVLLVAGCGGRSSGASGTTAGGSPGTVPLPPVTPDPTQNPNTVRSRYSFNNQCFALVSRSSGKYVAAAGAGYSATADKVTDAEAFYMKPSALGQYLLYGRSSKLLLGAAPASTQDLASATDDAIFTLKSNGDTTDYPAAPQFDKTPALADLNAYRNYADPNKLDTVFTLTANNGQRLAVDAGNVVTLAAAADAATQRFSFEAVSGCATFPEAHDNTSGDTFKGTYKDPVTGKDRVLGMADVHVHMMSSTFLGGALHGAPFHKFGTRRLCQNPRPDGLERCLGRRI